MLSQRQTEEVLKCKQSVLYFVQEYGWMRHLELGPIRFVPWEWQASLFNLWQAGKSSISNKSRQVGASWCAVAFACWIICFHPEMEVLLLSQKQEKAEKLLGKLTYFYDHIPDWLRPPKESDSKTQFSVRIRYLDDAQKKWISGEGKVSSLTTTGTSGAGESARLVIIDEFALMTERGNDEAVWAAIAPTTTHGGQMIILSTPRGSYGEFYRIWNDSIEDLVMDGIATETIKNYREWNAQVLANADRLLMVPTAIHYSMCHHNESWLKAATRGIPDRRARRIRNHFKDIRYDKQWRDDLAKRLKLSPPQVMQEFELQFDSLGNAVFSTEDINACYKPLKENPWVRELIGRSRYFYIGIDTAEGMTAKNPEPDYHSIVVLNQLGVQVYAYHSRESIDEWAGYTSVDPETGKEKNVDGTVLKVIKQFQPCTVILEKNGGGLTVQNRIENVMPDETDFLVISMSSAIKPQLVSDFAREMADEQAFKPKDGKMVAIRNYILTDHFTVRCMRQFIKSGPNKFEAAQGAFDDPVIALLWAAYGRRTRDRDNDMAVLPSESDINRPINASPELDLEPGELANIGPLASNDLGISMGGYDEIFGRTGLIGGRNTSLGGRVLNLGGRRG